MCIESWEIIGRLLFAVGIERTKTRKHGDSKESAPKHWGIRLAVFPHMHPFKP